MAIDIELIQSNKPIKNGTIIGTCSFTGKFNSIDTYVNNKPGISDIESKYSDNFNDITYYTIGGNATLISV